MPSPSLIKREKGKKTTHKLSKTAKWLYVVNQLGKGNSREDPRAPLSLLCYVVLFLLVLCDHGLYVVTLKNSSCHAQESVSGVELYYH